jgi:hypothetical protein
MKSMPKNFVLSKVSSIRIIIFLITVSKMCKIATSFVVSYYHVRN